VIGRRLEEILSPGTFYDAAGGRSVRGEEQCMLGVYVEPWTDTTTKQNHWYIASTAFDVSTGRSISAETDVVLINNKPVLDSLQPFWSLYPPAEVAFAWCAESAAPKESDIASLFPTKPPIHILALNPVEEGGVAMDRIRTHFLGEVFRHSSALSICEYLEVERTPQIRRSLYHLLRFLQDHNPSFLTALHSHRLWSPEENLNLGNAALEQLAMLPSCASKEHESLLHWLQQAQTAMGRRALRERCLKPSTDIERLEILQERIEGLRPTTLRGPIQSVLRGAYDLHRLYRRFQLGNGTTHELLQLLGTYEKARQLILLTEGTPYEASELATHISELLNTWDADRIQKSTKQVSDAVAVAVGSCHPWKRGLHDDLDRLEDSWLRLESEAQALRTGWEEILEETNSIEWILQEDAPFTFTTTARRGASIVAIAKSRYNTAVSVIKHGASTKITLDCEQLHTLNSSAIALRAEWKACVAEKWREAWVTWTGSANMCEEVVEFMGALDAECALAAVAEKYGYVKPRYVPSTTEQMAGLEIKELRHPIIERLTDVPYISHNVSLGSFSAGAAGLAEENVASSPCGILLYGVNAAGKSSLGKALGLAVLMAQCGIPVPATSMTLIPYTGLFTRILGNDNLWAGMSSFVVEMTEFRSILRNAGARSLVIGDELCAGTETASATSIVAAGIQTLLGHKSHFFFATHLHELAEIPEILENDLVKNYHLTVHSDPARSLLIYDRKLRPGCGSPMYGLEVCRGLDMDSGFLASAFAFRRKYYSDDGKARISAYNAAVVVSACAVCGSKEALETHHIIPQASADIRGMVAAGKHKNVKENLAVLCDACHMKHHHGMLEIQGWVATTEGRRLASK
jgi:DNA mismatch repair protein MutS